MAKESFDKEIQVLRMLMLTSGAYNRQQFAERLGISVHTFDKTTRRLKEIAAAAYPQSMPTQSQELSEALRHSHYDTKDPVLMFLFRAKSLKESESLRISIILEALHEQAMTVIDLMEICCSRTPADVAMPDEKTIRSDLKYLEAVGVVCKENAARPYRYRLDNELLHQLSAEELSDVYDFVDVMANTQVPSVQGYLLRDVLKKQLMLIHEGNCITDPFIYKYHYPSRILDEAHLFILLRAIRNHRRIRFLYFSPKAEKSYAAQQTNPRFEREAEGKWHKTSPLKIVYDHQYGRWYLLCSDREGIRKFRMEGITQLEEAEAVSEEVFQLNMAAMMDKLQRSWLIDTGRPVKVRARFYNPEPDEPNFIKKRVQMQGQWGEIVEEDEHSFVYEITVNGIMEIKPWLRSFGSSCEVLEPRHLRKELIEEWKEIAAYYESI
ncbi:WYL domain-containing protein [Paenibacillus thiaminolyticus]|uniref:helix-turn-helix transcriptional regulator n=1 Tax=Paenibacillus thiaminolyticus TaxID=49283 RepID=UPI00232E3432|nr:WYL domain-containing protein [Paenibacillus thiaminolyticus]WCF07667.1 WYL domain-containing protein [Paenibacillus thiaminolyticus]